MKKLIFLSVFMIAMISFSQSVRAQNPVQFNLSMEVAKYIETTPTPLDFNFGVATHNPSTANMELVSSAKGVWNIAYANCPFSVTISGNNAANEGVPRFARQELGTNASGYDVLNTMYQIFFTTNGPANRELFYGNWLQEASNFPHTKNFEEAPHNGQIKMDIIAFVNSTKKSAAVPVRKTAIDPNMDRRQSADAGIYECTMQVTFIAL